MRPQYAASIEQCIVCSREWPAQCQGHCQGQCPGMRQGMEPGMRQGMDHGLDHGLEAAWSYGSFRQRRLLEVFRYRYGFMEPAG